MNNNGSEHTTDTSTARQTMARGAGAVQSLVGRSVQTMHSSLAERGLSRPADERVVAGVFSGIGRRFGLDPWPSRLALSAVLLVIPGSQLLAYPVLWALMPSEKRSAVPAPV